MPKVSVIQDQEPLVRYRQHSDNLSKNLRTMLQACDKVTERAFELPPPGFKHLKGVGISLVSTRAAWTCIINNDTSEAFWFTRQALIRRPNLIFSKSYIHLVLVVVAKHFLKPHTYKVLHSLLFIRKQGDTAQYE